MKKLMHPTVYKALKLSGKARRIAARDGGGVQGVVFLGIGTTWKKENCISEFHENKNVWKSDFFARNFQFNAQR